MIGVPEMENVICFRENSQKIAPCVFQLKQEVRVNFLQN